VVTRVKKIIGCFFVDVNASKTAVLLGHDRNTINHGLTSFDNDQEGLKGKLTGKIEVDDLEFNVA